MPKIATHETKIDGKYVKFEVWYNQKKGFYFKDFPMEVWSIAGYHHVPDVYSEHELYTLLQSCLHKYHEAKKHQKKVILVDMRLGIDYIANRHGEGSWIGIKNISLDLYRRIKHDLGNGNTRGIQFDYKILYQVEDNGEALHSINPNGTVGGKHTNRSVNSSIIMEYTPERQEFMDSVKDAFDVLARKLIDFFDKDMSEVIKSIDERASFQLTVAPLQIPASTMDDLEALD